MQGLPHPQRSPPSPAGTKNPTVDFAQLSQMRPLSSLWIGHRQDELDKTFPLLMGRCVSLATRCRKPQSPGFTLRTCVKDRYADFQTPVCAVFFGCCPTNGQAPGRMDRVRRCTTIAKVSATGSTTQIEENSLYQVKTLSLSLRPITRPGIIPCDSFGSMAQASKCRPSDKSPVKGLQTRHR
jgi:hypothetical protein